MVRFEKSKMAANMAANFSEKCVYTLKAATTCILFVLGLKMFIIEEMRSDNILLCHKSLTEHHIFTIKASKDTKFRQILKKKSC